MSIHYQNGQEPDLGRDELRSLEEVREFLAADVVEILSAVRRTTDSDTETHSPEQVDSNPGDSQTLLCAAIADLEVVDERLQHARPKPS